MENNKYSYDIGDKKQKGFEAAGCAFCIQVFE